MPWPFRRGRTVTVTRSTINPRTQDRSEPTAHTLDRCAWDPGTTRENAEGDSATTTPRVFAAYDADILPTDQVSVDGVPGVWEVDGEIIRWRNDLTGTEACSEIRLTRKRGSL